MMKYVQVDISRQMQELEKNVVQQINQCLDNVIKEMSTSKLTILKKYMELENEVKVFREK